MSRIYSTTRTILLILAFVMLPVFFAGCGASDGADQGWGGVDAQDAQDAPGAQNQSARSRLDTSRFIAANEDEPDTVDFQCTTIHYTIAINVFNRLVETETDKKGNTVLEPSLAKSWEESEDGCTYTFHLRDDVKFSNGAELTSSDVLYTFKRLLTHPDACNQDIIEAIDGAQELARGEAKDLKGFRILSDTDFEITLSQPFEAFLASLSMPGASILDETTTEKAGDRFGKDPKRTIGTGPFILYAWEPGEGMLLTANQDCWEGAPASEGLDLRFITEPEDIRAMFEEGELDILDLDDVGNAAEFYLHGDVYQNRLHEVNRVAMNYIALNETVKPLGDPDVRKALQLALNREALLDAVYDGRGQVENGLYCRGLYGYNEKLPAIPYDPKGAKDLLTKAGYPDGFDLTINVNSTSTTYEMNLMKLVASMWQAVGVNATIDVLGDGEFMKLRKTGKLPCFSAMWTADYDDPDTFAFTFFGSPAKTAYRSICYTNERVMQRVRDARQITDPAQRLKEYRRLEQKIVQEDCAWIPLFSRYHYYVTSDRVEDFHASWNGSVKNEYSVMSIKETP